MMLLHLYRRSNISLQYRKSCLFTYCCDCQCLRSLNVERLSYGRVPDNWVFDFVVADPDGRMTEIISLGDFKAGVHASLYRWLRTERPLTRHTERLKSPSFVNRNGLVSAIGSMSSSKRPASMTPPYSAIRNSRQ